MFWIIVGLEADLRTWHKTSLALCLLDFEDSAASPTLLFARPPDAGVWYRHQVTKETVRNWFRSLCWSKGFGKRTCKCLFSHRRLIPGAPTQQAHALNLWERKAPTHSAANTLEWERGWRAGGIGENPSMTENEDQIIPESPGLSHLTWSPPSALPRPLWSSKLEIVFLVP